MRTRRSVLVAITAAVALLLAACSGNDESSLVEPIEPILASEVEFAFDPSGTFATLTVDTTIPVACAVIYGTDGLYGSIAVDNDMQGGAHQDHGPLLVGLRPDTEYQYILQGSDAAGTIYRSDPLTFRTPTAIAGTSGTNIAGTGTVTGVSSEFSDSFGAGNAIDDNPATEWSTAGDGDDAFIQIDLGRDRTFTAVALRTRQMTDGTAITETYTITVDGRTVGPYPSNEPALLDPPVSGRVVRIDADQTTGGNTGATEIEIYADE